MNAKKVKAIRQACRSAGADPTDVRYKDHHDLRGRLVLRTMISGCGRAIYQVMKEKARE